MKKNIIISCIALSALTASMTACGAQTAPTAPAVSAVETTAAQTTTAAETTTAETTTAKATETTAAKTAAETTASAKTEDLSAEGSASVKDIAGVWFEDALDARTLTINEDGTFTLEYKGGGFRNGTVSIDYETFGDGSKRAWYILSEDGGESWINFPENEDGSQLLDIWAFDQDGEIHFRRDIAIKDEGLDEPNEYGFYLVSSAPESGISIAALNGTWKDDDGDYIYFHDGDLYSGSFVVTYADKTIDEGYVQLEYSLNPDDSKEFWYNLYKYDGEFFLGFGASGDIPLDDLYAGQSGDPHYTREESGSGSADDFLGVWACGSITASIDRDPAGEYINVDIHWSASASEGATWTYRCTYDESANVLRCKGLGSRVDYSYSEDGTLTDSSVFDGSDAVFEIKDGALTWSDDKEDMDEELELLR